MIPTQEQIKQAIEDAIETYRKGLCTHITFLDRMNKIRICKDFEQIRKASWFDMHEEYKKQNCVTRKEGVLQWVMAWIK